MDTGKTAGNHGFYIQETRLHGGMFAGWTFAIIFVGEKEVTAPNGVTVIYVENTRKALSYLAAAHFGHPAKELTTIGITGTKGKRSEERRVGKEC